MPVRGLDRLTMAVCAKGHRLACVSGSRLAFTQFDCDRGCGTVMHAAAERWACSRCNYDICNACEPKAAAEAEAAADAVWEAVCAKAAAVTAAAVRRVVDTARAEEERSRYTVRVRLGPYRSFRASPDWGGRTLTLETTEVKRAKRAPRDYKSLYEVALKAREKAEAAAAEAMARAADAEKRLSRPAASTWAHELTLTSAAANGCEFCATNKRRRNSALAQAAAAAEAEEAAEERAAAAAAAAAEKVKEAKEKAMERASRLVSAAEEKAAKRKERVETLAAERAAAAMEIKDVKRARDEARSHAEAAVAKATRLEEELAETQRVKEEAEAQLVKEEARAKRAEERLATLKESLGIDAGRSVPDASDRKRGLPMIKSAIADRSATDVSTALKLAGGNDFLRDLLSTKEFAPLIRDRIEETFKKIQDRWSPRLAVLIMSDLQLSREQFEALRHYLSFEYDVADDVYRRLELHVNPFNHREKVMWPSLAPRHLRDPERDSVFGLCGVESSADGMVSYVKDQRGALAQMASDHWEAISQDVKEGRRSLLVAGFGDATGGWRGSSITHFELGLCSWEDKDIKQGSKSNLLPAALAEGDDGADNLRVRFQPVADGFDSLASGRPLAVILPSGRTIDVPIDFTFCGDFQIHKAILGMSKYTSAIWCMCDHETTGMFRFRDVPAVSYAEVLRWYDEIGCVMKTLEKVCELNHFSHEVLQGRPFKRFRCSMYGCDYEAKTETQWRADMNTHIDSKATERKKADLEHGRIHRRHRKFLRPMLAKVPPLRMSVDTLHILFINMFVTYLEATVLCYVVELDEIGRRPIEAYLSSKKIHIKIVKANDLGEMKESLIGRDAKVFMDSAEEIIPELLCFLSSPKPTIEQAAEEEVQKVAHDVDSDEFTWEGDGHEDGHEDEMDTLEKRVAVKIAGARVQRVAAAEPKGELLDKCFELTKANMSSFCTKNELAAKRHEIAKASIVAVLLGSKLLGFTAYLTNEREGDHIVTYLFELHRDLLDNSSKGLGSLLEAEVEAAAISNNQSIMLTCAAANSARGFYAQRGYWVDISSPQNHATAVSYIIMRKYPSENESVHERDARFWDNFYTLTRSFRKFESDTDDYREFRAVELFNSASQVGRDVKVLRPTLQSACPHILANVIPRQIKDMGDPLRRGCDQSESVGANMKSTIHRRVARNKITGEARTHTRRNARGDVEKTWTQKLKFSRVMQAFRAECVRERILRDPESAKFLQRKHHRLLNTGRASKARTTGEQPDERKIAGAYVKRLRELQEEGGAP